MKFRSLALVLVVCASMSLVAQIHSPSTAGANDGRSSAIHVLSATTFTELIPDRFSWVKELLREFLLCYGAALKDTLRSLLDASSSITGSVGAAIPQHHRPTQMSSACKGFPTS